MNKNKKSYIRYAVLGSLLPLICNQAAADVKTDPGDYTALPAGTDLMVFYQQHASADNAYSRGRKTTDKLDLTLDVSILRYVHFMQFFNTDYVWNPQIVLPMGRQRTGLANSSVTGIGDVTVGGTLYTIADRTNHEYLGWSAFFTAPTGGHEDDGFALSNNRWAADFQLAYSRRLAPNVAVDLIAETERYTRKKGSDTDTDPLYQGHVHLRWLYSPGSEVALTYRKAWGAAQTGQGIDIGSRNDTTIGLTWARFFTKQVQGQIQYFRDINIDEGPKLSSVQLRVLYAY
ncbi:transporter [Vreelandella alkaliphila]|uniref:transporter n=1 Tax=Vreelandella alkaliphila TaxID=272774 RepID=UPI0039F5706D